MVYRKMYGKIKLWKISWLAYFSANRERLIIWLSSETLWFISQNNNNNDYYQLSMYVPDIVTSSLQILCHLKCSWSSCHGHVLSHVRVFVAPWTVAHQAPLPVGFSRQGHCSGVPCSIPGDLPDPTSPTLAGRFFTICRTLFKMLIRTQ